MKTLTAQQIAQLRAKLNASMARLEREIRSTAMGPVVQERDAWGRPMRGSDGNQLGGRHKEQAELGLITAAFERLDAGTYGTCLNCAADVPFDLLLEHPAATTCEPCEPAVVV